jgi:hypothetical protein
MTNWIAHRKLLYAPKGGGRRKELLVRIGEPYRPEVGWVNFPVDEDTAACSVQLVGLDSKHSQVTYGADSLQALQLASDVEPMLRRLSEEFDLFFPTGESYFDSDRDG